jgi:hypothetical protein
VGISGGNAVQTLTDHKIVSGLANAAPYQGVGWRAGRVATMMALAGGMVLGTRPLLSQAPAVVVSSQVNITPAGGLTAGPSVVDNCGNVYVNQGGQVVEFQAGTAKQTVIAPDTIGYTGANAIAIDSTRSNIYFDYAGTNPNSSEFYMSAFYVVSLTNCTPGGISSFGTNSSYLFSYYYGTAGAIAVDGYGDVFFTVTSNGTGDISEVACGTAPTTPCTSPPTAGATSNVLTKWAGGTPTSLAADATGDIFFTDSSANVYELKPPYTSAPVTIGSGFTKPIGVTIDAQGNLYIADAVSYPSSIYYATNYTSVLYEIPFISSALSPSNQFIVANNLGLAYQVAVDASQNIYYTSYPPSNDLTELVIGGATLPSTSVGKTSASNALNYVFNSSVTPAAISVDTGTGASAVFANAGGGCTAGTTYTAGKSCSIPVTFQPSAAGLQTGAVVLASSTGAALSTTAVSGVGLGPTVTVDPGTVTQFTGTFKTPEGATVDSLGNLYVVDAGKNSITEFAAGVTTGTTVGTGTISLSGPSGVAVDGLGDVYIADTGNNRIVEIPVVNGSLSNSSTAALTLSVKSPGGLAFDGPGNLYIADTGNNRLLFVPNHNGALNAALVQTYGTGFSGPLAVTVDSNRNVFVADSGNNAVEELPGPIGSQAQVKVVTGLNGPSALTTDASGSLYVVDKGSASVFKFPNYSGTLGTKTLVGGSTAAPYGIGIDNLGNLYVTDSVNALVDKVARVQTALQFGAWNVGSTSTPFTATVSDAGNITATFPSPSYAVSGNTTAGFLVTSDGCGTAATVSPGASCAITATFTPPATELNAQENLTLSSNADNGTAKIALIGTGAHITPSTLTLALTSPPAGTVLNAGASVTFTATLGTGSNTATPGGTITFSVNGSPVGTVAVTNGAASITLPNGLPGGSVVVGAVYSGDQINYSGSSTSITETVIALPDTLTFAVVAPYSNPSSANDVSTNATGPTVALVATLAVSGKAIPGGTVSFYSGTSSNSKLVGLASVVSSGGGVFEATLNEDTLRAGTTNVVEDDSFLTTYNLFAVYSGDTTYGPSTSNSAPLTIVGPPTVQPSCTSAPPPLNCAPNATGATFTITPANPSITIASSTLTGEGSGSVTLTINSYGGWQGVLNFTCSGLPTYAACATIPGSPSNITAPNSPVPPITLQFIINTNVPPLPPTASGLPWGIAGFSGLLLLIARRRLRKLGFAGLSTMVALVLLTISSIGSMSGCGSAATHVDTPAGTTNVNVAVSAAQVNPSTTTGATLLPDPNPGSFTIALTVQ